MRGAGADLRIYKYKLPLSYFVEMLTTMYLHLTLLALAAPCNAFLSCCGSGGRMVSNSQLLGQIRDNDDENTCIGRRTFVDTLAGSVSSLTFYRFRVDAMGLVQFPCNEGALMNRYHLMRAGQSGLEEKNVLSTNPLFLTNSEDGLTALGMLQVEEACSKMIQSNINPSVVKYSLASKCIETANMIANTLMVGRNRIVPEFTFMDPRGAGYWNGKELSTTEAALFALDVAEAGDDGRGGRPPPNEDGTANETLWDQVIRLRQLMSVLETQYSGDTILLIFPDGTSPALLSCLIAGVPLRDVHAFNFEPGEVRVDVTMKSTLQSYSARKTAPQYVQTLEKGKDQLAILRKEQTILTQAEQEPSTLLVPSKAPALPPRARTRQQVAFNDDINDIPKFSDYMPIASLGTIATMTMLRPQRDDDTEKGGLESEAGPSPMPSLSYADSTNSLSMTAPLVSPNVLENNSFKIAETAQSPMTMVSQTPVLSKEERIAAANKAMAEYLERDDGGEDWLLSVKDMLGE